MAPVIDPVKIKELEELNSKDQDDIVCELIEYFFSYGVEKFLAVQKALESMDMKNLERNAHALKSVCFNIGANRLIEICEQVETIGRTGDKKYLALRKKELESKLDEEFKAASTELKALASERKLGSQISKIES